ncbi:hypothetical protein LTR37_014644 [Vermiconidia calcicola]|uniref:Uncharacterized protein n=1 Tax=Vermiconidia calcicola TaxID=1690605 RepID=A0ACC3MTX0_9PEZI|nr:hypothetical protein LTR37_014644 [Vermiconidia calcicola]
MTCGVAGAGKSTLANTVTQKFPTFQRVSIDGILASRHGLVGVNYLRSDYDKNQDEAGTIFLAIVEQVLDEGNKDLVLDRSFYAKEDGEFFKSCVEQHGGRWVLVYLNAPKEVLWHRICARREAEINADSALEISRDLLDNYCDGFEIPNGEGELAIRTHLSDAYFGPVPNQ